MVVASEGSELQLSVGLMNIQNHMNMVAGAHVDTLKIDGGKDTIVKPLMMTSTSLQAEVLFSYALVRTIFIIGKYSIICVKMN